MPLRRRTLAAPLLALAACGERAAVAIEPPGAAPVPATAPSGPPRDARVLALAAAFELGRLAEVESGLATLADGGGLDGELLRARLAASRGDDVSAVRTLEAAKLAHPRDARVLATAAELHAAAGRLRTAEDEVRAGLALEPGSVDLRRARGVLLACTPGGAEAALAHLLGAREADPELPYARRPLAEAHRLAATTALSKRDPARALQHVEAALVELPGDPDLELLGADARMLLGEHQAALDAYESLLARGRDVGATLAHASKSAATAALVLQDRPLAIRRFLRARELGLGEEALGFGASLLADESAAELERGWQAYDARELERAEASFREALRLDPRSLDARRAFGAALYARGDFEGAAAAWRLVLDTARSRGIELAEPVHLDLARALHRLGRLDEVRSLLEGELAARPDGPGADEAREMLGRLERR